MIPDVFGLRGLAVGILGGAIFGLWGGWTVKAGIEAEKVRKALDARDLAHREAVADQQADYDALQRQNIQLAADLAVRQDNVRTVTREIIKEVPKYIQESTPGCDRTLRQEMVQLINSAASNSAFVSLDTPDGSSSAPELGGNETGGPRVGPN